MYDKWKLSRNPFYTRPIDLTNLDDFAARQNEYKEMCQVRKGGEGVVAVIGERGVGTTSLANYARFIDPDAYTFAYEIKVEQFEKPREILESIVYSMASDILEKKIPCAQAHRIVEEYNKTYRDVKLDAKIGGFGLTMGRKSSAKTISTVIEGWLKQLIKDVLRKRSFKYCIFQMNNFDAYHEGNADGRIESILNFFRDIFHIPGTIWYLLGDHTFKDIIERKVSRVSSIVRHWVTVKPLHEEDFIELYKSRIRNSGAWAKSPFSNEAVKRLARCSMGRPRFAFDVAAKLIDTLCDSPYPDIIGEQIVEQYARQEIGKIVELDSLSPASIRVLEIISKKPGITAKRIAELSGISSSNLPKYLSLLRRKNLISVARQGRSKKHFAAGLAKLLHMA